jgi:hypothetical protein
MSLSDLRKELKELRKSAMPTPVSKMRKADVSRELERLKGLHSKEEKKVEAVMEKEKVAKPIVEKVKKVQEKEHAKQEKVVEKKPVKKVAEKKPVEKKEEAHKPSKYIKGSAEAKEHMAKIRASRSKKDE